MDNYHDAQVCAHALNGRPSPGRDCLVLCPALTVRSDAAPDSDCVQQVPMYFLIRKIIKFWLKFELWKSSIWLTSFRNCSIGISGFGAGRLAPDAWANGRSEWLSGVLISWLAGWTPLVFVLEKLKNILIYQLFCNYVVVVIIFDVSLRLVR
jgi:hypothetical protein